jgi:hypothetical protein
VRQQEKDMAKFHAHWELQNTPVGYGETDG